MSVEVMARVWKHSKATGVELLLLVALADYAGDDGYCYPRQDTLAEKIRTTDRNVRRYLTRLEKRGEVFILSGRGRPSGGQRWDHNRYVVAVGMGAQDLAGVLAHHFGMSESEAEKQAAKVIGRIRPDTPESNRTNRVKVTGRNRPKLPDESRQSNRTNSSDDPSDQPSDQPSTNHQGDGSAAAPDLITTTTLGNGDGGGSIGLDAAERTPAEICGDFWAETIGIPTDKAKDYIRWALERLPVDEVLRSIQKTAAKSPKNPDAYFRSVTNNAADQAAADAPDPEIEKLRPQYLAAARKIEAAAGRPLTKAEGDVFFCAQRDEVNAVVLDAVVRGVADGWRDITHKDNVANLLAHRLDQAKDGSRDRNARQSGAADAGAVAGKFLRDIPKNFTPRRMQ